MSNTKVSKKDRFNQWVDQKLMPIMGKLGNQRHLSSIRDGFALVTPLIIAGAIGILIVTMVFGGWGSGQTSFLGLFSQWSGNDVLKQGTAMFDLNGDGILDDSQFTRLGFAQTSYIGTQIAAQFNTAGLGSLSIIFSFGLGYFLATSRGNDNPIMGGFVSLGSFLAATAGNASYYGATGLMTAILLGILGTEIYCWTSKIKRLTVTLPDGVPPAVSRSFAKLFPVIFGIGAVMLVFAIIAIPTYFTNAHIIAIDSKTLQITTVPLPNGYWNPADLINAAVQAPMVAIASQKGANVGIAIFYAFGFGFLWFFGLHGTNIMNGAFQAVWSTLLAANVTALANGTLAADGSIFVAGTFDAYINLGGSAATLSLIIATFIFSKKAEEKEIAKYALPAGVFNINEPVIFGYPLVVNFNYAIPTMLTAPMLVLSTWAGHEIFNTTKVAIQVPWTAPAGIGALFATGFDYSSFIIAIVNLGVAFLMWFPFVIFNSRGANKALLEANKVASPSVENDGQKVEAK